MTVVPPRVSGLIAAVVTPRTSTGLLDFATADRLIDLALSANVAGVCLGGATAEYPHVTREERIALMRHVAARLPGGTGLFVGIGAAAPSDVVPLGAAAFDAGAQAVLLSMPLFFPYAQDDLDAFCRHTAAALAGPVLLYDLPSFTTPLDTATIISLLEDVPTIVGIKDSSGKRDRLDQLVRARGDRPWRLIVGDDNVLPDALAAGWDASISGVAAFCPELLVALTDAGLRHDHERTGELFARLQELIAQISVFPTPWAIRLGLAARGIDTGPLPLPSSRRRLDQAAAFQAWVPGWLERVGESLDQPVRGR